jgi:hypothetical protein
MRWKQQAGEAQMDERDFRKVEAVGSNPIVGSRHGGAWGRFLCWIGQHEMEFWRYLPNSPFPEHPTWQEYRCYRCGLTQKFSERPTRL